MRSKHSRQNLFTPLEGQLLLTLLVLFLIVVWNLIAKRH